MFTYLLLSFITKCFIFRKIGSTVPSNITHHLVDCNWPHPLEVWDAALKRNVCSFHNRQCRLWKSVLIESLGPLISLKKSTFCLWTELLQAPQSVADPVGPQHQSAGGGPHAGAGAPPQTGSTRLPHHAPEPTWWPRGETSSGQISIFSELLHLQCQCTLQD